MKIGDTHGHHATFKPVLNSYQIGTHAATPPTSRKSTMKRNQMNVQIYQTVGDSLTTGLFAPLCCLYKCIFDLLKLSDCHGLRNRITIGERGVAWTRDWRRGSLWRRYQDTYGVVPFSGQPFSASVATFLSPAIGFAKLERSHGAKVDAFLPACAS